MFGAFLFGAKQYADTFSANDLVLILTETMTLSENTVTPIVVFVVNDFIFSSDTADTTPSHFLLDSIRLNDWLTVKPAPTDSTFTD
ncbi:MAG: hypothetical protein AB7V39_00515 [Nitrospiraceae bacterium]